ncbi:thioesterase domain-containing protein [Streptomyces sp. CRN 30]|uniref:thioesterase domain-containing protein n=1 Tax=Streptomyces sp. CRN 30 TaxID=3075613 RepID=UPI002A8028BF|nr:thioesterase domain-containing protein [Streptomyces sp. CRN 30]
MQTEDDVRATVGKLWSRVLDHDRLAGDTDFFAAGGSSLMSLVLLTELNEAFDTELEMAELADCRTIDRQSAAVWQHLTRGRSTPVDRSAVLVPLTRAAAADAPTIIAVHDVSGDVYGYTGLARELSGRATLHGLKLAHERFEAPRALTVTGLAEEYVTALEAAFEAPRRLVLLGWSLGGLIGFEMARLLDRRGRPLERLVLVDTPYGLDLPSPDDGEFTPERERALLDGFARPGDPPYPPDASLEELWRAVRARLDGPAKEHLTERLRAGFPLMSRVIPHLGSLNDHEFGCYVNRFRSVFRAGRGHRPEGTITTPLDLLTATGSRTYDPRWAARTSAAFRRLPVDGDHFSVLDRRSAPATARAILAPDTRSAPPARPSAGGQTEGVGP